MGRAVLQACLPWLALLVVSFGLAYLLVKLNRTPIRPGRLRQFHRDQDGSAQSLSFVLTLPFFVMIILFIVQVSQLMIGTVVVHYAAYAAARSAAVWIPAGLPEPEGPNCISIYYPDPEAEDQVMPILDPDDPNFGPAEGGITFVIEPGSPKYDKIASAAVLACMPISPSRDVGLGRSGPGPLAADVLEAAYATMVPGSQSNAKIPARLEHKLAWAVQNTETQIRFYHRNSEPPLLTYLLPSDFGEFYFNEVGWQDLITVKVKHNLALLPGPGRLLAKIVPGRDGSPDRVSRHIERIGNVYVYPLSASAVIGNEGEKSVISYFYPIYGVMNHER